MKFIRALAVHLKGGNSDMDHLQKVNTSNEVQSKETIIAHCRRYKISSIFYFHISIIGERSDYVAEHNKNYKLAMEALQKAKECSERHHTFVVLGEKYLGNVREKKRQFKDK